MLCVLAFAAHEILREGRARHQQGRAARDILADSNPKPCSWCNGTGVIDPIDNAVEWMICNLESFADFLEHCGGCEVR